MQIYINFFFWRVTTSWTYDIWLILSDWIKVISLPDFWYNFFGARSLCEPDVLHPLTQSGVKVIFLSKPQKPKNLKFCGDFFLNSFPDIFKTKSSFFH